MRLRDLPKSMKVSACSHVLEKQRPVRSVGLKNGVFLSCDEADHGVFGEKQEAPPTLEEVFQLFPWLKTLELEAGQRMELQENGTWKTKEIIHCPREMTIAEREAYYAERKLHDH